MTNKKHAPEKGAESGFSGPVVYEPGTRLIAYHIKEIPEKKTFWTRIGVAWVNRDGSLNVVLDVLPLDGKVHLRLPKPEDEGQE